jgi:hypothetical protein
VDSRWTVTASAYTARWTEGYCPHVHTATGRSRRPGAQGPGPCSCGHCPPGPLPCPLGGSCHPLPSACRPPTRRPGQRPRGAAHVRRGHSWEKEGDRCPCPGEVRRGDRAPSLAVAWQETRRGPPLPEGAGQPRPPGPPPAATGAARTDAHRPRVSASSRGWRPGPGSVAQGPRRRTPRKWGRWTRRDVVHQ